MDLGQLTHERTQLLMKLARVERQIAEARKAANQVTTIKRNDKYHKNGV